MGSPYRKGLSAGLVTRWSLLEFGRTEHDVRASEKDWEASREEASVERAALYETALGLYFEGVRYRSQKETWEELGRETELVAREVQGYVKTGQRSVVERMLVQDQVDEASATAAAFAEKYRLALKRLALLTGRPEDGLACPTAAEVPETEFASLATDGPSPYLRASESRLAASRERLSQASAKNYPQLLAVASAGSMDQSRLVSKQDYSAGVGFVLPLFDGLQTEGEIRRAREVSRQREHQLEAAQWRLQDRLDQLDQTLAASRVKLSHLLEERTLAEQAFKLAKDRYFAFQGTLVDVREALRDIQRVRTDINDVRVDLLLAEGIRSVVNGAYVPADK
jgi:outer membrane protein TolC